MKAVMFLERLSKKVRMLLTLTLDEALYCILSGIKLALLYPHACSPEYLKSHWQSQLDRHSDS
jgi:hypothetical protein